MRAQCLASQAMGCASLTVAPTHQLLSVKWARPVSRVAKRLAAERSYSRARPRFTRRADDVADVKRVRMCTDAMLGFVCTSPRACTYTDTRSHAFSSRDGGDGLHEWHT